MSDAMAEFRKQGFRVFPNALSEAELTDLRTVCDALLAEPIDDGGTKGRLKLGLGRDRQFLAHRHPDFPKLEDFVLGETVAKVTSECIGEDALLFNEQFVVKGPNTGSSFAWHQDSAYVGYDHSAYLTVWIALDDTSIENGCVYILPRDLDEKPGIDKHEWQEATRELNGYFGDESGIAMECPAGTVVAFSSRTLHRSGENATDRPRRAFVCQYSLEPIAHPQTKELKRFAKPLKARVAA